MKIYEYKLLAEQNDIIYFTYNQDIESNDVVVLVEDKNEQHVLCKGKTSGNNYQGKSQIILDGLKKINLEKIDACEIVAGKGVGGKQFGEWRELRYKNKRAVNAISAEYWCKRLKDADSSWLGVLLECDLLTCDKAAAILAAMDAGTIDKIMPSISSGSLSGIFKHVCANPGVRSKLVSAMSPKITGNENQGDAGDLFKHAKEKDVIKDIKDKDTILDALQFKRQIVLQGPPGTGKSYTAKKIAQALTGKLESELDSENAEWQMVQFHPSYNYEDFVRGIQVEPDQSGQVQYQTVNRIFAEMCETAKKNPTKAYVLIIDEMNRANLPAVLGELIYGLEYRGEEVQTPYAVNNKTGLVVPENLFVIGTMNTADRSIGHIDYAIRRRFAFIDVLPNPNVVPKDAKKHFESVQKLFLKDYKLENKDGQEDSFENAATLSPEYEANHVRIGHSYFMASSKGELNLKMQYEVLPILREYAQDGILDDSVDGLKDALASWKAFQSFLQNDGNTDNKTSE